MLEKKKSFEQSNLVNNMRRFFTYKCYKGQSPTSSRTNCYLCLISYRLGAWHYRIFPDILKSPVSKWRIISRRIVRVKTRTKAFFFEEMLINIPSENQPQLSKERMQYFWHVPKLHLRRRHPSSATNCSMNRSLDQRRL